MDLGQIDFERVLFYQQARMEAEAAYAKNPLDAENLTTWGKALLEMSQFQNPSESLKLVKDAASKMEEALQIDPRKHDTLWCLGNAHTSHALILNDHDAAKAYFGKATQCFQQALEEDPGNEIYMKSLEFSIKGPELHMEIQRQMANQQDASRRSSTSNTKVSKKKKKSDLKYDILGWVILAVGIVTWVGMAKSHLPPPPSINMAGKAREHGSPALWEKDIKMLFCDLCIKEIELGNGPTTFFSKKGWNNIIKHFKDATGREYDMLQMKNKWDQLKKDWKIWKDLKRGSTGLGWNPIKRTIDASEEWWAERLSVMPSAKKYKTCGIEPEFEEKLDQMFGGVVATGKYACAPSETGFGETQDNVAVSLSDDSPDIPSVGPAEIQSTNRSKRSRFVRKKKGGAASIRNQISCLMDPSNDAPHKVQKTSINEVVAILEQDPSIAEDDELYYFAVELLQDSVQRDFFTAIAKERRVSYLRHFYECKKSGI